MIIALTILMALGAFTAVVYPFVRPKEGVGAAPKGGSLKEINYRRDHTFSLFKELENDYQSGTLSKEDYDTIGVQYRNQAVSILKELDDIQNETSEVLRKRDEDIEKEIIRLRKHNGRFCAYCGAQQDPGILFCPDCGKRLKTEGI